MAHADQTHEGAAPACITSTVTQLAQAFEAWETDVRTNPGAYMTNEECIQAEVSQLSADRAAHLFNLLTSQA